MAGRGAAALAVWCLGIALGCGAPSPGEPPAAEAEVRAGGGPLARIERGMRPAEVEALAGPPPAREERAEDTIIWYYEAGVVIFRDGRVRFRYPLPRP